MVKLLAFLLCERATFSKGEKVSLHELFDGLRINRPASGPPPPPGTPRTGPSERVFYVFYKIVTSTPCTMSLRVVNPSGVEIPGNWVDPIEMWSASEFVFQSIWALTTGLFPEPGRYLLELLCSDGAAPMPVAQTQLYVE